MSYKSIGINIGETRQGLKLNDGGCALVEDGLPVVAIAEERLTRKKYDGGFVNSLKYCLEASRNNINDVDVFVFSNCCDEPLDVRHLKKILRKNQVSIPERKIVLNQSHHLSHAFSAFFASPFKEAMILVADNEGNILEKNDPRYWLNRLERTSIYYGKDNKINLFYCLHDGFKEIGLGAAYNYFTQWIGFRSYQEAGKTMALASFGRGDLKKVEIFADEGKTCLLKNGENLAEQIKAVGDLIFEQSGRDIERKKSDIKNPSSMQKEVAWLIQKKLEDALISIVSKAVQETGVKNLCIAGGVGLNCVANYKILKLTKIKEIFIQPAAGDSGQCLGNAFYGYYSTANKKRRKINFSPYLGRNYQTCEIETSLDDFSDKLIWRKCVSNKEIASLLVEGKIMGWFQGKSEFGPRALGSRSILVDPRNNLVKSKLNILKSREYYRPYAPVVLEKETKKYFNFQKKSPFMLLAVQVLKGKEKIIPNVVHKDGSARIQTINNRQNPKLFDLIENFKKITGIPLLLNTSFNRDGEPLVESPSDAINCFLGSPMDYLVLGDFIVSKKDEK